MQDIPSVNDSLALAEDCPLFTGVSRPGLESLLAKSRTVRFASGDPVVFHGDESTDVFVILEGVVRVTFFAESGRDVIFRDMRKGEMLGILSALDGIPRSTYVVARSDVLATKFTSQTLNDFIHAEPEFGINLLKHTSELIRHLTQRLIEFATEKAATRIRLELLRLARRNMVTNSDGEIHSPPTHAELASSIGSHREAVSREISSLDQQGVLRRGQKKSLIVDTVKLEEILRSEHLAV